MKTFRVIGWQVEAIEQDGLAHPVFSSYWHFVAWFVMLLLALSPSGRSYRIRALVGVKAS